MLGREVLVLATVSTVPLPRLVSSDMGAPGLQAVDTDLRLIASGAETRVSAGTRAALVLEQTRPRCA